MTSVKVQQRKVTAKGKDYSQYWIALPKVLCESLKIEKGSELEVFIDDVQDITLRKRFTLPFAFIHFILEVARTY
jgi:bifunctional DNA-binding transcriptional regulator/antitoxin component of YhaV-PrlF toxin-antitoxin module